MINIASKAGNYLRATNQVVASGLKPLAGAALSEKKVKTDKNEISTVWSLTQALPAQNVSIKAGIASEYRLRRLTSPASLSAVVFSSVPLKII